jgi:acyl-CoA thioesterase II
MSASFSSAMQLQEAGRDRWVAEGVRYPWGVLYGGQAVAHALVAAAKTVDRSRLVHSLHAYYLEAGRDDEPVELVVQRLRDGRSFSTRAVVVHQAGKTIATVSAGFHVVEESPEASPPAPEVERPERLAPGGWSDLFDRRYAPAGEAPGRTVVWTRMAEQLGDDTTLQAGALAYVADDAPDEAVIALLHPELASASDYESRDPSIGTQSLDFALWFHRPLRADGWLLHDFRCSGVSNACAMVLGEIYDAAGGHLATVGQHVLLRYRSS